MDVGSEVKRDGSKCWVVSSSFAIAGGADGRSGAVMGSCVGGAEGELDVPIPFKFG